MSKSPMHAVQFHGLVFTKCGQRPLFMRDHQDVPGPVYCLSYGGSIPSGWLARHPSGEWLGWNVHGDFWTSYGRTREDAAQGLMGACWRQFQRAKPHDLVARAA